jgi:uncharacterized protein YqgC (DUF456 family)
MLDVAIAILLSLIAIGGWMANILGLPGNWVIVATAIGCAWWVPETRFWNLGWYLAAAILVVALIGEALEFAASAVGASRLGGSKRGVVLSIVGSITGAILGLSVGSVVPIVGNIIASLLLGATGAFLGAMLGERWAGKDWNASIEIGGAAFWGRLLGTVGKAVCGTAACGLFLAGLWM